MTQFDSNESVAYRSSNTNNLLRSAVTLSLMAALANSQVVAKKNLPATSALIFSNALQVVFHNWLPSVRRRNWKSRIVGIRMWLELLCRSVGSTKLFKLLFDTPLGLSLFLFCNRGSNTHVTHTNILCSMPGGGWSISAMIHLRFVPSAFHTQNCFAVFVGLSSVSSKLLLYK